jgi:hypothetical protein
MNTNIKQIISGTITALTFPINSVQEHLISTAFFSHPLPTIEPTIAQEQQLSSTQAHVTEELRLKALIVDLEKHLMEEIEYTKILAELPKKLTQLNEERRVIKERINVHRQEITSLYKKIKSSADFTFAVDASIYQETEARKPIAVAIANLLSNIDSPIEDADSLCVDESIKEQQATNQTVAQFSIIKAIITQLQQDINILKCPMDKKRLLDLKEQQSDLLPKLQNQLNLHHIEFTIEHSQRSVSLKKLKETLERELDIGLRIKPKLKELNIQFTKYLSTKRSQKEQQELRQKELEASNALERCSSKINALLLTEEQRTHLIEQFNESPDTTSLIALYKNKIHSIINVKEWAPSLVLNNRQDYINTQNENKLTCDFFTKYHEQNKLQALKNDLSKQLEPYENLPACTEAEEKKHIEQVRTLLNQFSSCNVSEHFPPLPQAQDYYDLLLENIPLIDLRMDIYKELLVSIDALIPIATEIEEIRTIHNLPEDQDNLLQPLAEYISALPEDLILEDKVKLSEQYTIYIDGHNGINNQLNLLVAALKEIKAIEQHQSEIKNLIEEEKRTIKTIDDQENELLFQQKLLGYALEQKSMMQHEETFAIQIENNAKKLAELQAMMITTADTETGVEVPPMITITEQNDSIRVDEPCDNSIAPTDSDSEALNIELALPALQSEVVHNEVPTQQEALVPLSILPVVSNPEPSQDIERITEIVPIPEVIEHRHRAEQEQLKNWHQVSTALLEPYSNEIKNWYKQLYAVADQATQQASYSYQYSHLIRDVFFELTHKRDIRLLEAYKRICPNPPVNLDALLTLKPHHSLINPPFDNADIGAFPRQLQELYGHYLKLKPNYPMEAELLLQATQALHSAYQTKANNPGAVVNVARINKDPRYIPLKRHRGLGVIWELIEDFFHFLIGKMTCKATHEYTNTPCFFNTRSYSLMEKADRFIKETGAAPIMV